MIDEVISQIQPFITIMMLILLCYFVYGFTKRNLRYMEFPEDCTVIYKPEITVDDETIFKYHDPWLERFDTPESSRNYDLNLDHDKIMARNRDNNVVR
jgi:hypothetical protein